MPVRPVKRVIHPQPTLEGAGVHLQRVFGFGDTSDFDPFLLLDDFRGDKPQDYQAGFPWHPHRGIETITYVLAGTVEHADSIGNRGIIAPGDVQWMTAGGGIIHQEMPHGDQQGRVYGFQLWANLQSTFKMTTPRYQGITASHIPVNTNADGTQVRVICGRFEDTIGPVKGVAAEPTYLDVSIPSSRRKSFPVEGGRTAFAYVFGGKGKFWSGTSPIEAGNRSLLLFDDGDEIAVESEGSSIRFLLVSGKPIREPVAWRGPVVMNTQAQLRDAFRELEDGTFLKQRAEVR